MPIASSLGIRDASERCLPTIERGYCRGVADPLSDTLPHLFEAQVKRTPEAVAIIGGDRILSYRELDIASNRLAHELRNRGIVPGSRVAIFLDRSPELVVALLAVLKGGCAYIPLDPTYPADRLEYVFANSRPLAIITNAALSDRWTHHELSIVNIDSPFASLEPQGAESLVRSASPTDPAYVIYTSGSTGQPKGVVVRHSGLSNLLRSMQRQPGLTHEDTVLAVTTISFDIAALELFLPLIVGAKLIIASELEMADGAALLWLLRRHAVTFMQGTPVLWQILLEAGWQGDPPLRMLCGGEALPRKLAERLLRCGGELWNMYGPTETTIWSSALQVESGEGPVPIGPPIANTQFYILDAQQELTADGEPGELFIGGDGVALGYFELPDLTNEKFVPDKFRKLSGAKLYRTGDVVRMKKNRQLEFLGRADTQIKLRGFRIELGEVETVLLRHPDVDEAVAVLGHDASGEPAIKAYVVAKHAELESTDALIAALKNSFSRFLPSYMHPAAIIVLAALPRTPNGKIDRRSLPMSSAATPIQPSRKEPVQPLNEIERRLATIWSAVLGIDAADKSADFFELGGHSLLAARLLARIDAEFGQRLSLLSLFKAPSIREQAKLLMQGDHREYDFRQVVQLHPNGSQLPLIAIHNTGVCYYNLAKRLGPNQPLTALQLFDPSMARKNLPQTLEEIAAEYLPLIRSFQPVGPYQLIGWCVGGVLAFEVARQLVAAGEEVSLLTLIDAWAPGHSKRISRTRAMLADYSYRWQLIAADWRRVMSRKKSLAMFLTQRTLYKKLRRLFGHTLDEPTPVTFATRELSAENYDQWLLGYLEETAQAYEPKMYPGKITLLCSTQEPKGLFLDRRMGWSAFALKGVDVAIIDGDHFTVFNGRGLEQMATHVSTVIKFDSNRRMRQTASA